MPAPLRVAITGASGLLGTALVAELRRSGHTPIPLVRGMPKSGELRWDPAGPWDATALDGIDGIVHLAGESIADGRWTAARKAAISASRIEGTRSLVDALRKLAAPPKVLVSASAMGYYGSRGDEVLDENAGPGTDWLGGVAVGWEGEAMKATTVGCRVAMTRFGLLLSPSGGLLGKMVPPFKMGMGGTLGDGKQWMSWITVDDTVRIIISALLDDRYRDPINCVTPNPVTNAEFTHALGTVLHRPTMVPVPRAALQLLFGELADAALLASQRLKPAMLEHLGFSWKDPELIPALQRLLT